MSVLYWALWGGMLVEQEVPPGPRIIFVSASGAKKHLSRIEVIVLVPVVSKMTQVLIEGRGTIKHVMHLMTSWVGIGNQNLVSHQVGLGTNMHSPIQPWQYRRLIGLD